MWQVSGTKESVSFIRKMTLVMNFTIFFACNPLKSERKNFLTPHFYKRSNIIKFKELLSTENRNLLIKLSCFIQIIMKKFSSTFLQFHITCPCHYVFVFFCFFFCFFFLFFSLNHVNKSM